MIYINDEQDEQKAQLEEVRNSTIESVKRMVEEGNLEGFIEQIHFYSEIIEMMARALVNKNKE